MLKKHQKSKNEIIESNDCLCGTFISLEHEQQSNDHGEMFIYNIYSECASVWIFGASRLLILNLDFIPPARIWNSFPCEWRFSN